MSRWYRGNPEWQIEDELPIPVVVRAFPGRCLCGHSERQHGTDRKNRFICYGSAVCGCIRFREDQR